MMIANMAAGNISLYFGLKGISYCPVSACSSSAHAIGEAFEAIKRGQCEIVIAGGAEAAITPLSVAGFSALRALSTRNDEPEKASRPFDKDRDGFVIGEGAGILILEDSERALSRGAHIYCEVVGYGATSDAYHITAPDPEAEEAARAMKLALEEASISPQDVNYINAHGTSTPYNDEFETLAIKKVLKDHAYSVAISSTKSMTGHLLGAAGGLEAAVCALSIDSGIAPPTINLDNPDPQCDLDYVPHNSRKMEIKVALSNSLGFGGHNVCLAFKKWES
jgi:3-oxoacyl-[acyl-carrier-protein] synthase II